MYTVNETTQNNLKSISDYFSSSEMTVIKSAFNGYRNFAATALGELPIDEVLSRNNQNFYHNLLSKPINPDAVNAKKIVIVLKATRLCNLRCTYCHSWAEGPGNSMTFETLAHTVREILAIPNVNRFEFVWHGGEVTMLKPTFFKKLIWLQQQFKRPEQYITNSIQSNAVNISDDWLVFLKAMGMSVGISVDGIPKIHDLRRVDTQGKGTSGGVKIGIQRLKAAGIDYGALVVVDEAVAATDPDEMFQYFDEIDLRSIDFLNIVPDNRIRDTSSLESGYISYADFITFLSDAFKIWWCSYREKVEVGLFKSFVSVLKNSKHQLAECYWSDGCSQEVITLEANGDVTPCDKYVGDIGSNYGSLLNESLANLLRNSTHNQKSVVEEIQATDKMKNCKWFSICHGGCPHDRIINRLHVPDYDDICCGTGKLLQTIKDILELEK